MENINKFIPSPRLTAAIEKGMIPLDKETLEMINAIRDAEGRYFEEVAMESIISDVIENFLTATARRQYETCDNRLAQLTMGGQFTLWLYGELIEQLELIPAQSKPILDLLSKELIAYASTIGIRKWGKIIVEHSELHLVINEEAFRTINIDDIDDSRWTIT